MRKCKSLSKFYYLAMLCSVNMYAQNVPPSDGHDTVNIQKLEEVVATALGISKRVAALGYSAGQVKGEELVQAREINFANALVGKVAGLNSSAPSTGPGGSSRVTIRGNTSLSFDNQPLYIVDGILMNNDNLGNAGKWGETGDNGDGISSINPDDIESMSVLKGGAASALYGQRGRNGVILVTTKSGRKGKMGIEFNSNTQMQLVQDFSNFQTVYGQGLRSKRPGSVDEAAENPLFSWGEKLDGKKNYLFNGDTTTPYSLNKNNIPNFYNVGKTYTNTISFLGGTEVVNFRVSVGNTSSTGIYPGTYYNRNNVAFALRFQLTERLSGSANVMYIQEDANRSRLSDGAGNGNFAIRFLPNNVNQSSFDRSVDKEGKPLQGQELAIGSGGNVFSTNPYFAKNFRSQTTKDRVLAVASLKRTFGKSFYLQVRVANDFFSATVYQLTPSGTAYKPLGKSSTTLTKYNEMNADILAGYDNKFGDISLSVVAGANLLQQNQTSHITEANEFSAFGIYNPAFAASATSATSNPRKEIQSLYGSVEIGYKNTVYLTITDRNDWSSTLPVSNNSYNYLSANFSVLLDRFLKVNAINLLKIRGGVSQTGGDAPIFATNFVYKSKPPINSIPVGYIEDILPNANLKPLIVTGFELGTEFKLFNGLLAGDITYFSRITNNDIATAQISVGAGYRYAYQNAGQISNHGVEILLSSTPVHKEKFAWTTSVNFLYVNTLVDKIADGTKALLLTETRDERAVAQHVEGMVYDQIMVYDYKKDTKTGKLLLDANGLPQRIDKLHAGGTGVSPITGGWSNSFTFGNFYFNFLIDFKFGAVIYSGTNSLATAYGLHEQTLQRDSLVVDGLIEVGGALVANTKKVSGEEYWQAYSKVSKNFLYDASFIKLRSVSLGYVFPAKMFNNKIQSLSIAFVARNLLYLFKATPNIDPESNYQNGNGQGVEYGGLPTAASFGFNLNIKL